MPDNCPDHALEIPPYGFMHVGIGRKGKEAGFLRNLDSSSRRFAFV